jgi:hypothetical protein
MTDVADKFKQAPCSFCSGNTRHMALFSRKEGVALYEVIQCLGCEDIHYATTTRTDDDIFPSVEYFPSLMSRQLPSWKLEAFSLLDGKGLDAFDGLLDEVYKAVRGKLYRIALMGIRALMEHMMISKVGDQGTFRDNLNAFHERGYISLVERDAMTTILDAGHAVMHRLYKPMESDLNVALDILEGIFAAIYVHPEAAEKVGKSIPPRAPRVKK